MRKEINVSSRNSLLLLLGLFLCCSFVATVADVVVIFSCVCDRVARFADQIWTSEKNFMSFWRCNSSNKKIVLKMLNNTIILENRFS